MLLNSECSLAKILCIFKILLETIKGRLVNFEIFLETIKGRRSQDLCPPGIFAGSEICFNPWNKHYLPIINISMNQRQRQRSWSPDNLSLIVVLGSMARADELVLSRVPWHDTTKVGAHSIDPISCKCFILLHNEVRRVTLQPLCESTITGSMGIDPVGCDNIVA